MADLADRVLIRAVVDDQVGRLTFTDELTRATHHLLDARPIYGTYNVTNSGPVTSWCDLARQVFELKGRLASDVSATSTAEYSEGKSVAPRPLNSALSLQKIEATGFTPRPAEPTLRRYLRAES